MVYFRGQTLSEQAQVEFTANFGRPEVHVRDNPDEITPGIFVVSNVLENGKPIGALGNDEISFHSDLAYMPKPGTMTMLYALEIPTLGGNTQWCSGYAAYAALDAEMQSRLQGLRATHRHPNEPQNPDAITEHPMVCTHPESGRKTLFITPLFTQAIIGLSPSDSAALLTTLRKHMTQPQFIWTHVWQPGDVVMWDNRATMHRCEPFPADTRRVMKRTQIFNESVSVA